MLRQRDVFCMVWSLLMEECSQNRWEIMSELKVITVELPFGKLLRDILKISKATLSGPTKIRRIDTKENSLCVN